MAKIFTASIPQQKGKKYLDITVKSGDKTFAPTWKMVMGLKNGEITREQYIEEYTEMMRKSYKENRDRWEEVLGLDEVVLACYCKPDQFCHRVLLAKMMEKCGAEYLGEV